MTTNKHQLIAFAKAMRKSHASSKAGTATVQKLTIVQSPDLRLFSPSERAGQPLKSNEWRSA